MIMIDQKTEKDCNGLEGELYAKIQKGDLSWLPIRRSKSLGLHKFSNFYHNFFNLIFLNQSFFIEFCLFY